MSIPIVVTGSSRAVMDVIDFLMVSRIDTGAAQAAILPGQLIMWSYIILGMGTASLVNTFASQSLGRGKLDDCSRYAWQGIYLALAFGVIGLAFIPMIPSLVALLGHESEVQALEIEYARVAILTVAPSIAANVFGWFFIGVHKPNVTMWSALEANVVNIAVSPFLIFGWAGCPELGIAGAAWGTLAAVVYRSLRLGLRMIAPDIHAQFHSRSTWRLSLPAFRRLLRTGLPCGLQFLAEVLVWAVFVNVLVGSTFGTAHLIATNTAWQYMRIAFLPTMGVGQAITALVGRAMGEGQPDRAVAFTRIAEVITLMWMGINSALYIFAGRALIGVFSSSEEVIAIGTSIMVLAAVFQFFDAMGVVYSAALRGAGDTFVPSVFFAASHWIFVVGGGWTMVTFFPELGSRGPWLAAAILFVVTGVFLRHRWRRGAWRNLDILSVGGKPAPELASAGHPQAPERHREKTESMSSVP